MFGCVVFLAMFKIIQGAQSQCSLSDIKSLFEGCDHLSGMNITTLGGTMVNDHNCDVLLPKQVFFDEPLFRYSMADPKKFYTIMLLDADSSQQLEGEFYLHMLKSNVPGLSLSTSDNVKNIGVDYRGYKPPAPVKGTGHHRIMALLYEQSDGNNFLANVPTSRNRFRLSNWLHGKNLCGPVAGIQFRTEY